MQNTHLEHIEDNILFGGKESAYQTINFLENFSDSFVSVKWDGAPAIVFGTHPGTGKFFVGTKSVFNKKKIKINYTHSDIDFYHEGRVANILHTCLECLPRVEGVYQGDFIGFGGDDCYRPNTIEYQFNEVIEQSIIFVVHTKYVGDSINLRELSATFNFDGDSKNQFVTNSKVKFLSRDAYFKSGSKRVKIMCALAKMIIPFVSFPEKSDAERIKKDVNSYIRNCKKYSVKLFNGNILLYKLYSLVTSIKHQLMKDILPVEKVECYIADEKTDHEGFVVTNKFGTFKFVNRQVFSYNNFMIPKNW